MASRIGTSTQAAWFPGSPVYDGLHRRYGSIVEVDTPRGSSKANAVKLTGYGLTWWTNARDVITLEGERPNPVETGEPRRNVKGNPELAVVSLGMNPPRRSKAQTFPDSQHVGRAYRGYSIRGTQLHGVHVSKDGYHIATVVDEAHAQAVIDMLHGDATPNVAGNPGEVFGSDVLGIVYQHEDDRAGDVRVHLFGQGGEWRETRGGRGVELYHLPSMTGVQMRAEKPNPLGGFDRVVMEHKRGRPLVGEF